MHTCQTPHEWLRYAALQSKTIKKSDLLAFILVHTDSDQVQDFFQTDMDNNGYFDKCYNCDIIIPEEECGGYICEECGESFCPDCFGGLGYCNDCSVKESE